MAVLVKKSARGNGVRVSRNDDGTSNAADIAEFSGGRVYDCGFGDVCVDYHQTVTRSRPGDWVVCNDEGCEIVSDENVQKTYSLQDAEPAAEKKSAKDDAAADEKAKRKESEAKVSGGEKKREEFTPGGAANEQQVRGATGERPASTPAQREQERRDEQKR